jgi:arylsulfatase B
VTTALKARGMFDDTVVYFTTDNGAPTPACGGAQGGQNVWPFGASPTPLRGGKCSCWEGGLRGTAFVYSTLLPSAARGRYVYDIMHAVDVLPTLLSAVHGATVARRVSDAMANAGLPLDGVDQWATIAAEVPAPGPRTEVLLEADPWSLPLERQYVHACPLLHTRYRLLVAARE